MNIDSHRISCYHTDVIEFCARLNDNAIFRIAHENQVCMLCQQFASPLSGRRCCWHFYIDNIANGRKDEAMTEYAPNLGHAVCFPVRKEIAAVNKDIMWVDWQRATECAAGLFYFRKGYKLEFSRKNQSGQNQGRYTHFRSRQGLLRTPAARLWCSTGGAERIGFYMDRLHLTAENDPGWWASIYILSGKRLQSEDGLLSGWTGTFTWTFHQQIDIIFCTYI